MKISIYIGKLKHKKSYSDFLFRGKIYFLLKHEAKLLGFFKAKQCVIIVD